MSSLRLVRRWAPFVVPVACLAAVLAVQPRERFGAPDGAPWAHQAVLDDFDTAAYVVRAVNHRQGRRAGRRDEPDWPERDEFARALNANPPLEDRYYLEYPHAAVWLFRLGFAWQPPRPVPAAVLDGHYGNVGTHAPRGEAERALWRSFRLAGQTYTVLMVACLLALVLVLRAGYLPGGGLSSDGLPLVLPAALYYTLYRFDVVPALLTALALAALGRRWWAASGVGLAAATMIKVYPVLLVPLVLRYLGPTRAAVTWAAAFAVTAAVLLLPPLVQEGAGAVWAPYHVQLSREPYGPVAYGSILPAALADNDPVGRGFRFGCLLLTLAAALWRRPDGLAGLLARAAVVLIVFVGLAVFYSPQWVLWLAPLLLPLTRRVRGLVWLVAALDVVTYLTSPLLPNSDLHGVKWLEKALTYARFALFAGIVVLLVRGKHAPERPSLSADPEPAPAGPAHAPGPGGAAVVAGPLPPR